LANLLLLMYSAKEAEVYKKLEQCKQQPKEWVVEFIKSGLKSSPGCLRMSPVS